MATLTREIQDSPSVVPQHKPHFIPSRFPTEVKENKKKSTIAVLDGVRAIACLIVLSYHICLIGFSTHLWDPFKLSHPLFGAIVRAGMSGVTLFFVLSGFLLFMPYAKALLVRHTSWPLARHFYLRRAFRIIPAYYVCLLLLILLYQRQYLQPAHWPELGLFLSFFHESSSITYQKINGPFWTLGVEWQFYMLLPLLVLGMRLVVRLVCRTGPISRRLWTVAGCLGGVIAWGLFTRYWGFYFAIHPSATFLVPRPALNVVLFFTYGSYGKFLEDFAVGMLLSLLFVYAQQVSMEGRFNQLIRRLSLWLWGAGILLLVFVAMWQYNLLYWHVWPLSQSFDQAYNWLGELGFSLGFGLCILGILFGPAALKRPFEWPPLRWIGLISFSLYMWHLPLLIFFMTHVGNHLQGWNAHLAFSLYWLWALLVIIPLSALSFFLIEKPGMRLGGRITNFVAPRYHHWFLSLF